MPSRLLPLLLVLLGLVLAGCGGGGSESSSGPVSDYTSSDHDGYHGALLPHPYRAAPVTLTDTQGRPFSLARDTRGHVSMVFFGYSHCPDICQTVMGSIASAYARLTPDVRRRTRVVFVTTDPARDNERVLRTYLDRFNPAFTGLTGPLARIEQVAQPFGIFLARGRRLPSGGYEVDHTTSVLGMSGNGTAPLVWDASTSPDDFAADVTRMVRSGSR